MHNDHAVTGLSVSPARARGTARSCSFDDDGNNDRTGSLAPVGYALHALHFSEIESLTRRPCRDGRAPVSRVDTTGICVDTRSSGARDNEA